MNRFWSFKDTSGETAELFIYDVIANKKSHNWWDGSEGSEAVPKEFYEELTNVKSENIVVRINSPGGEVFAAEAISTAIRSEREKGKKITCKIDGICASAAVQIALSCEKVSIPKSSYMMIHDPLTFCYGYYQAKNLDKLSETLGKIKKGIVNSYHEKTGIEKSEIEALMREETWFTGDEAVDSGFADEVLFEDAATGKIQDMLAGNMSFAAFAHVPEKLKEVLNKNISNNKEKKKGENEMEIKNAKDLALAYPEFVNEITENAKNAGIEAERARIFAIDELSGKADGELIRQAKYETFDSAEKVAFNALKEGKFVNDTVLSGLSQDATSANKVAGKVTEPTEPKDDLEKEFAAIDKIAAKAFKKGE